MTRINAQQTQDPRARALLHLCEVIPKLTSPPTYILLENVNHFQHSQSHGLWLETMKTSGYVCHEFLLSPAQIGIPNERLRYYCLAKRQGANASGTRPHAHKTRNQKRHRHYDTGVCAYTYLYKYIYMCIHMFMCNSECIHICEIVYIYSYLNVYLYVQLYVHVYILMSRSLPISISISTCIWMCIFAYVQVFKTASVYADMNTFVRVCVHIYTYKYT